MHKKKVILSYDYELFFGDRSGTVQKTLIEPTNQLLDAMDRAGLKGNFFVDWLMLKYLALEKDQRAQHDYDLIVKQLKDIVRRGHRIELHIHPHWVNAKYNGDGTWDFSEFRHYSLNSFTEQEVTEMFVEGTNLLESIAREVQPDYKIIAFRAGGWAIQPFSKLKKGFISSGLVIDSSTAYGVYSYNEDSYYDFRKLPSQDPFFFEDDVLIRNKKGIFIEVPITTFKYNIFLFVLRKSISRVLGGKIVCQTDGTHCRAESESLKSIVTKSKWERINSRSMYTFSSIPSIIIYILALFCRNKYICFIDHPKDYTAQTCSGLRRIQKIGRTVLYSDLLNQS